MSTQYRSILTSHQPNSFPWTFLRRPGQRMMPSKSLVLLVLVVMVMLGCCISEYYLHLSAYLHVTRFHGNATRWSQRLATERNISIATDTGQNETSVDSPASFSSIFIINRSFSERAASWSGLQTKVIFAYNRPRWLGTDFSGCEASACWITTNVSLRDTADAVLVSICRAFWVEPPAVKPVNQIWIAFALEAPMHCRGAFSRGEWKGVFNWTFTYRHDSDLFHPYAYLVYRPHPPHKNYTALALGKIKMAAWFVSHCHTTSRREEYVEELKQHMSVDVYGRCGTERCGPRGAANCSRLLNTAYFFYLSFENAVCRDYVTEKFFKVFDNVDIIPVVRGGAAYKSYFPPGTFIDVSDFTSARHLALYLRQLASDAETYAAMLRRKDHYVMTKTHWHKPCHLCHKLHHERSVNTYSSLPNWLWNNSCTVL